MIFGFEEEGHRYVLISDIFQGFNAARFASYKGLYYYIAMFYDPVYLAFYPLLIPQT